MRINRSVARVDVVIVGAGVAGLTCAQVLHQAGYNVTILEKSRGVGGRLATRRLEGGRVDHGTCYLSPRGGLFQEWLQTLVERDIVQIWTDCVHEVTADGRVCEPAERSPRYVAADGMSAIAKSLIPGLNIHFNQRVVRLEHSSEQIWHLTTEASSSEAASDAVGSAQLSARAVVVAIPAPQALDLLAPLQNSEQPSEFFAQLQQVGFNPCIAVMAGYTEEQLAQWQAQYPQVKAIAVNHPDLAWIGLDSSKRRVASYPVFVLHSTAAFAQHHLDTADLTPVGRSLLQSAAELLLPGLAHPTWMQVHRWRYAFPGQPLPLSCLVANMPAPLVCAGDWCGGRRVESALQSGLEAACRLNQQLEDRPMTTAQFWPAIVQR
ncbi:MAG: FAD-dependent oxidoreductase [Leptolyngbyaceae cyanobacterium bins.349]|nr:FAD-dependent oxidoreductase [Leptolyngbyaceae cyanobacterium bins.349]